MTPSIYPKKTMAELNRNAADDNKANEHFPIWIVLDDVRSMHNVGSAFRTADAFNVSGILLCGYTPVPPHRDIHKTALGATESVHWEYEKNIGTLLQQLKTEGYKIYGIEQVHNSIPLQQFELNNEEKCVFIFGNEVSGISQNALQYCDACIEIPQWGAKHSLNISVSIGVVLWEMVRRK